MFFVFTFSFKFLLGLFFLSGHQHLDDTDSKSHRKETDPAHAVFRQRKSREHRFHGTQLQTEPVKPVTKSGHSGKKRRPYIYAAAAVKEIMQERQRNEGNGHGIQEKQYGNSILDDRRQAEERHEEADNDHDGNKGF